VLDNGHCLIHKQNRSVTEINLPCFSEKSLHLVMQVPEKHSYKMIKNKFCNNTNSEFNKNREILYDAGLKLEPVKLITVSRTNALSHTRSSRSSMMKLSVSFTVFSVLTVPLLRFLGSSVTFTVVSRLRVTPLNPTRKPR
jgi:hypothetical protein